MKERYKKWEFDKILEVARQGLLGAAGQFSGIKTRCIEQAARPNERPREGFFKPYDGALCRGELKVPVSVEAITKWLRDRDLVEEDS